MISKHLLTAIFLLVFPFIDAAAQSVHANGQRLFDSIIVSPPEFGVRPTLGNEAARTISAGRSRISGFGFDDRSDDVRIAPAASDIVVGPCIDTLRITRTTVQRGNIFVLGQGVLIVDAAELSVAGHLEAAGSGTILVHNGAQIHFDQQYVAQY